MVNIILVFGTLLVLNIGLGTQLSEEMYDDGAEKQGFVEIEDVSEKRQ